MANGFFLNGTASPEIDAERRMVRHYRNSPDVIGQILRPIRVFSATPNEKAGSLRFSGDRSRIEPG
jgi:hypothetical protein